MEREISGDNTGISLTREEKIGDKVVAGTGRNRLPRHLTDPGIRSAVGGFFRGRALSLNQIWTGEKCESELR